MPTSVTAQDVAAAAKRLFEAAAAAEGITLHDYCRKYGIVDAARGRQIRRHEERLEERPEEQLDEPRSDR